MIRYSTPEIVISADVDLSNIAGFWISFKQDDITLRKTKSEVSINQNVVSVTLTQEETAMFIPKKMVQVQLRWIDENEVATGSNIVSIYFDDVLEEEVITLANSN